MAPQPPVRKVLFLAANPTDTSRLRLDQEIRDIQEGLRLSTGRDSFKIITQWAVRPKDLRRALLAHAPHIVHFSGHGAGETGLILESNMGQAELVSATVLSQLFKLCPSVECVVLNACYSQVQALAIAQYVPYVIGMNQAIDDGMAIQFAVGFYDALGYGRSLAEAYEFGMAAIATEPIVIHRETTAEPDDPSPGGLPVLAAAAPVLIQRQRVSSSPSGQPATVLSKKAYRDRNALLNKVKSYWIKGVLDHSLHHQVLINLGLEERVDLADPFNITLGMVEASQHTLPANSQIIDIFDDFGPNCTLLILGEPGSGKTITLLQLTRDLLARAEQTADHPMPVVFNLSSWNGKQSIAEWLVAELNLKYQVPKAIGQSWVDNQEILLLLDGLDEVRADRRADCVVAINQFQRSQGTETVICSRIKDYEALSQRLTVQQAIYVQALQPTQIAQYLQQLNTDLTGLQQLLQTDQALQELASSPLMLNILILAYEGVALDDLLPINMDGKTHRHRVFNTYIERMLKRRGNIAKFSHGQTVHWLSWLAQQMIASSQTIFLIEWLNRKWLANYWQQWLYSVLSSLIVGLAWGLIIVASIGQKQAWLSIGLGSWALYSLANILSVWLLIVIEQMPSTPKQVLLQRFTSSLWTGLSTGIMLGTIVGVIEPEKVSQAMTVTGLTAISVGVLDWQSMGTLGMSFLQPIEALKWSWTSARKYLLFTLIGAIPFGLIQGIAGNVGKDIIQGLFLTMFGSLIAGTVISLRAGAEIETRTIPNQGIWRSLKTSLITALTISVAFIPGGYLLSELGLLSPGLGRFFGLWIGLLMGGTACIVHLSLRLIFYGYGYMPWNYARFLDNAAELAFLQKVGGGYMFIHRSLMEHFAQLESSYPLEMNDDAPH